MPTKRREIAESVISGRKTGADMARLYSVSAANRVTHRRRAPRRLWLSVQF